MCDRLLFCDSKADYQHVSDFILKIPLALCSSVPRALVFRLVTLISYHGPRTLKQEMCEEMTAILLRGIYLSADDVSAEHAIAAVIHFLDAVDESTPIRFSVTVSMQDLLKACISVLRRPCLTHGMATHALALMLLTGRANQTSCYQDMFETQTSGFAAALTRSESPIMCAVALLIGRNLFDRLKFPKGPANLSPPPLIDSLPTDLKAALDAHGRSETSLRANVKDSLKRTVISFNTTRNIYRFARNVAALIPLSPMLDNDRERLAEPLKVMLDNIPVAIEVLREHPSASHTDDIDTLALYHLTKTSTSSKEIFIFVTTQILSRNPRHTFALFMGAQHAPDLGNMINLTHLGLRSGGESEDDRPATANVYLQLVLYLKLADGLYVAALHGLLTADPCDAPAHESALQRLASVREFAERYVVCAPPDCARLATRARAEYGSHDPPRGRDARRGLDSSRGSYAARSCRRH